MQAEDETYTWMRPRTSRVEAAVLGRLTRQPPQKLVDAAVSAQTAQWTTSTYWLADCDHDVVPVTRLTAYIGLGR